MKNEYDYVIIGGGFFGCCLALFLRSISAKILLVESEPCLLNKASKTNQGRIHTGFHYPRSGMTALRSLLFHRRFINDFHEAIEGSFQMLYAIAKQKSKVTANRFLKQFEQMGAPIKFASSSEKKIFNHDRIEAVFRCY
jgi:glycine/D-amino acid oxidase-like deaminating enzyme